MPRPSATATMAAGGWSNVRKDLPITRKLAFSSQVAVRLSQLRGGGAEHQQSLGMVGCRGQQTFVVGIAAHHPMQHNDVVRLDLVRRGRNVELTASHPAAHPD